MVGDQIKPISDLILEIKNVDMEIAENEVCFLLRKKRAELLQEVLDRVRSELVLSTREVRRYRTKCEDCLRCSDVEGI
jgi:hypothetical protein